MHLSRIEAEIGERLDALKRASSAPPSRAEVLSALSEVLAAAERDVHGEIRSLADLIAATRQDIAALRPHEIQDRFIPTMTDELDAVVSATEAATNTIMGSAERIEEVARSCEGEAAASLGAAATAIYEACSFQDIAGQRIGKIVGALKEIETRVQGLLSLVGRDTAGAPPDGAADGEAALLDGPQLPDRANEQDDIDRLFARRG